VFPVASESGNARKVFITEAEKQKLRDAAARDRAKSTARMKGLHLKVFVELLFAYGWRKGELIGLRVKNVDLMRGVLRIETSKSGEGREVALTQSLKTLLQAVVFGRKPNEPLFPVKDMRWAWRRLCKEAGVPCGKLEGVVMHDARRTTARAKRSAGVPESVINASMGWKPGSKMLARYGIVSTADTLEAQQAQERWELDNARSQDGHTLDTLGITNGATSCVTLEGA
jgi:integrase